MLKIYKPLNELTIWDFKVSKIKPHKIKPSKIKPSEKEEKK